MKNNAKEEEEDKEEEEEEEEEKEVEELEATEDDKKEDSTEDDKKEAQKQSTKKAKVSTVRPCKTKHVLIQIIMCTGGLASSTSFKGAQPTYPARFQRNIPASR